MHDHNLDDLIIGGLPPENSKTKGLLTIIALFIVVMIVAIVLTRILLKTPDNDKLALEENMTEMIAPELKLQETPKEEEPIKEPSISSMVNSEVTPPAPETNTSVAKDMETDNTVSPATADEDEDFSAPEPEAKSEIAQDDIKELDESVAEKVKITQEYTHVPAQEKKTAEQAIEKPVKETVKKVVKKVTPPPTPIKKPVAKPVAKPTVTKPAPQETYYIQVGSFTSEPSARFLSTISNSGFNYTIVDAGANGSKKLLIGPYSNKNAADGALVNVKDRINKSAFVIEK